MDAVSEIKSKLTIEELVSEYVSLKNAGKSLKGLCPWHQEKTPSFIVNPEKQICWCFACQKGGDIFNFLEYTENLEFMEILQILGNRTGVKIDKNNINQKEQKESKIGILSEVANFYSNELKKNENAMKYLEQRGIGKNEIITFGIGYAPKNGNLLYNHLIKLGFKKNDILSTGVLIENEFGQGGIYDRFHTRIIFPICSSIGKTNANSVIGFGARIFNGEKDLSKYINSPDSGIFDKSSTLFRLDIAKDEIKKQNFALIVEGYLDVISCYKHGIKNCIASNGTAFTENQIKLLKRFTQNLYFCFDADNAGFEAAKRVINTCSNFDVNLKFIQIPNGKDPDESLNTNSEEFKNAVKKPLSVIDFLIINLSKKNINTLEGKKNIEKEIFEIIINIYNNLERQEYLKKLSDFLNISEKNVLLDFENFINSKKIISNKKNENKSPNQKLDVENYLIGLYISYPNLSYIIKDNLIASISSSEILKKVYKYISNNYNVENFLSDLDNTERERVLIFSMFVQNTNEKTSESKIIDDIKKTIKNINLKNILSKENELLSMIKKANESEITTLTNKYQEILKLKNKLLT